jgi:hypothetical protein
MKTSATLAITMLLLVAGCSSPTFYWYHPDRSLDEAKADYGECQDQARRKAADMISDQHYDRLPPPDGSSTPGDLHDPKRSPGDPRKTQEAWRERYEQSVLADSMRERGYLRLRTDRVPRGVHTKKFPNGAVAGQ